MTAFRPALRLAPLLLAVLPAFAQEERPAPPEPLPPTPAEAPPPLVPGRLPQDAAPAARELWERFVTAHRAGATAPGPVTAFRVQFALRTRRGAQTNDINARLAWREPALVRFSPEAQAEVGRDASGRPWLKSGNEIVPLRGRAYETDREQLDQAVELAQAFARLSDPTRLRIAAMREARAPAGLPTVKGLDARKLVWIELDTPDFALGARDMVNEDGSPVLDRVRLGLEGESLVPRIAHVARIAPPPMPDEVGAPRPVVEQVWVLDETRRIGQRRVPHRIFLYERLVDPQRPSESMRTPTQELYLSRGEFDIALTDRDFEP